MSSGSSGSSDESDYQSSSGYDSDSQPTDEVPKEVAQFVQELVDNTEAVEKKNKELKKQISILQKKCDRMREYEQKFKKHKVEMLQLFRKYLEKRSVKNKYGCKSCPSVESDLKEAKGVVASLLIRQKEKDRRLMDKKKELEKEKLKVADKELEVKKFQEKCSARKLEEKKHFRKAQWEAQFIKQRINEARDKIVRHFGEEGVTLAKEAATAQLVYEASIEAPTKFEEFEREVARDAELEVQWEIASRDCVKPMPPVPDDWSGEFIVKFRREMSMKSIDRGEPGDPVFIFY